MTTRSNQTHPAGGRTAMESREELVSEAFVALADTLVDDYDMIELLDRLVGYSVALLAADAAGIMIAVRGDTRTGLRVVASSSEHARVMELLALQAEEGPCLECFHSGIPISVADVAEVADRWPAFAAQVSARGSFRSVHALPLRLRGQPVGVLSLFHRTPGSLPAADLTLGQALADVATIGILQERSIRRSEVVNEQLQSALNSRVIIEQAKGVLAQRGGLGMDDAFDRMRRFARAHNRRLGELSRQIVRGDIELQQLLAPGTDSRPTT